MSDTTPTGPNMEGVTISGTGIIVNPGSEEEE